MRELLAAYPVVVEAPVAWGEMDAFGHVNNVVYFRYFENARLAYFRAVGYLEHMERSGLGPILASTQCCFRLPLQYPDTVSVGARISDLEAQRFVMEYRVVSHGHGAIAAEGSGPLVSYDYRADAKAPLPEEIRVRIEALEGREGGGRD